MLKVEEITEVSKGKLIAGDKKKIPNNYVIDSRLIENGDFYVPIVGENVDGNQYILEAVKKGAIGFFIDIDYINKEKVIKEALQLNKECIIIEVENAQKALYECGKYNRQKHIDIPVIAITGSVGKTSTREMIASVLGQEKKLLVTEKNYNSCIGAPIMALKIEDQDICVLEAGINMIGEMELLSDLLKPNIAVITNIGTAHIGIFGNQENILKAKSKITSYMKNNDTLILNGDDSLLKTLENTNLKIEKYSINETFNISNADEKMEFDTNIYGHKQHLVIHALGEHNILNALCAIKVAQKIGISEQGIIKGIEKYQNFSRRMEKKKILDNVTVIDDTYNASIDSMISGLKTISNMNATRKIAILGDMFELGEYTQELHHKVGEAFENFSIDLLVVLGESAKYIAQGASPYLSKEQIKTFLDKKSLISYLKEEIKANDLLYFKASNGMNFPDIINAIKE